MQQDDNKYLLRAIELAKQSVAAGGFPAGAVVVKDGEIVGEGLSLGFKKKRSNRPRGNSGYT